MNFTEVIERAKTIAIDFDGTIVSNAFPKIGEPNMKLIEDIRQWYKQGKKIIIWTCRTNKMLEDCKKALETFGVPYNALNANTEECIKFYNGSDCRKVCADLYIDDKAINIDNLYDDIPSNNKIGDINTKAKELAKQVVREILEEQRNKPVGGLYGEE